MNVPIYRSYKHIVNCYYNQTLIHCGKEAADNMVELTIEIINSILVIKCDDMKQSHMEVAMPKETNAAFTVAVCKLTILMTVLVVTFSLFTYIYNL